MWEFFAEKKIDQDLKEKIGRKKGYKEKETERNGVREKGRHGGITKL